jgi:hypothetical protein
MACWSAGILASLYDFTGNEHPSSIVALNDTDVSWLCAHAESSGIASCSSALPLAVCVVCVCACVCACVLCVRA